MRNIFYIFILWTVSLQLINAQGVNDLVADFSKKENVTNEVIDTRSIVESIKKSNEIDPTGALASQIPTYMERLDSIIVVDLTPSDQAVKDEFVVRYNAIENGENDDYETLLVESDETEKVRILAKRNEQYISEILILAIDLKNNDMAIVKLVGRIEDSDIESIVKQQIK